MPREPPMRLMTTLICLAAPTLAQGASEDRGQQDRPPDATSRRLFTASCAACHLPPDPAFPVERAWITQLADTA